jgi:hypothetical protein
MKVVGRGRLAVAVAVVVGSTLAPAHASLPPGDDLTDQAATFGIRAIAQAGLLDPLDQYYGYDGIVRYEDRWVIAFQSSTCYRNERVETCDPNAGSREEPISDAWLEIVVDGDHFAITDAFGRFTEEQEADLRAYTEPAVIEETHLEFPTVRIDPSRHGEGWDIRAAHLWAGPLPAVGVWSVCTVVVYGDEDVELWRGWTIGFKARRNEYFRSNGLLGTGVSDLDEEPARAAIECELWTKETWTSSAEPSVHRDRKSKTVTVRAPLEWEHGEIVALESHCLVELLRRDGSVVVAKEMRGVGSPWGGRAERYTLTAQLDVRRPRAVDSARVTCMARGQDF